MNYPIILLVSAGMGLLVSILTALGVLWKASALVTGATVALTDIKEDIHTLLATRDEHGKLLERVMAQLDALEWRVSRGGL